MSKIDLTKLTPEERKTYLKAFREGYREEAQRYREEQSRKPIYVKKRIIKKSKPKIKRRNPIRQEDGYNWIMRI